MEKENNTQLDRIERNTLIASKNVLNVAEVSYLLGVSKSRVYHLCYEKKIPYYKQGKTYFKRDEVEAWLTAKRVPTQAEIESKAALYCINH